MMNFLRIALFVVFLGCVAGTQFQMEEAILVQEKYLALKWMCASAFALTGFLALITGQFKVELRPAEDHSLSGLTACGIVSFIISFVLFIAFAQAPATAETMALVLDGLLLFIFIFMMIVEAGGDRTRPSVRSRGSFGR